MQNKNICLQHQQKIWHLKSISATMAQINLNISKSSPATSKSKTHWCVFSPSLPCLHPAAGSSDPRLAMPLAGWSSSSYTAWEDPSPLLQARKQGRAEREWQLKHGKEKLPPCPTSRRRQRRRWVVARRRGEQVGEPATTSHGDGHKAQAIDIEHIVEAVCGHLESSVCCVQAAQIGDGENICTRLAVEHVDMTYPCFRFSFTASGVSGTILLLYSACLSVLSATGQYFSLRINQHTPPAN